MSRDLIILAPNGRRTKVHCTPDTSFLQVLEDVCVKQGFPPSDYDLKHHNRILDLTTTVRFCNIPNRATLEMVEAEKKRIESNVTVGLTLEDGERRTADFLPSTSLYDIIISLAPDELSTLQNPMIMYMRQEVIGLPALKDKTLRHLGLIAGRAALRLLDKIHTEQANVSSVYRKVQEEKEPNEKSVSEHCQITKEKEEMKPGPSGIQKIKDEQKQFDPIKLLKKEKVENKEDVKISLESEISGNSTETGTPRNSNEYIYTKSAAAVIDQKILERRLRIEEEVSFIGSQKAVAFMQPEESQDELADLPDDFYDLTIEEVRRIYHDLQQSRIDLESTPLLTSSKRNELQTQVTEKVLSTYKNTVIRIQFPDGMILQGVFSPNDTIEDILHFVKEHLHNSDQPFHIFSTPLKESLNPKMTLLEAKFVPCVLMHFKWADDNCGKPYLKEEIYLNTTSSDAASILASKYRAPTRRKLEDGCDNTASGSQSSKSKQSKVPKWFKK